MRSATCAMTPTSLSRHGTPPLWLRLLPGLLEMADPGRTSAGLVGSIDKVGDELLDEDLPSGDGARRVVLPAAGQSRASRTHAGKRLGDGTNLRTGGDRDVPAGRGLLAGGACARARLHRRHARGVFTFHSQDKDTQCLRRPSVRPASTPTRCCGGSAPASCWARSTVTMSLVRRRPCRGSRPALVWNWDIWWLQWPDDRPGWSVAGTGQLCGRVARGAARAASRGSTRIWRRTSRAEVLAKLAATETPSLVLENRRLHRLPRQRRAASRSAAPTGPSAACRRGSWISTIRRGTTGLPSTSSR